MQLLLEPTRHLKAGGRLLTLLLYAPYTSTILALLLEQVHYIISFSKNLVAAFMATSEVHVTPLLHVAQRVNVKLW